MGIGDWLNETYAKVTGKTPQQHADELGAALKLPRSVTTDTGASTALGAPPDARTGFTMTGGRRFKKTGRHGKKARKTRRGGRR